MAIGSSSRSGFRNWKIPTTTGEANNDAFRDHWGSQPIARERWERHYTGGESFRPDLSARSSTEQRWLAFSWLVVSPRAVDTSSTSYANPIEGTDRSAVDHR